MSSRTSGILLLVAVSAVLLVAVVIGAVRHFVAQEQPSKLYRTYEEARQNGAVTRGWLPSFVPTTSVQIYEKHDLDTNAQWLKFNFPRSDGESMTAGMTKLDRSERRLRVTSPKESWWQVNGDSPLDFYRVPGEDGYLAVDWRKLEAYYWNKMAAGG